MNSIMVTKDLLSKTIITVLNSIGIIYFFLGLVGGAALLFTSVKEVYVPPSGLFEQGTYKTVINNSFVVYGIMGIISSIVVWAICFGIARIIEQNIYLIQKDNPLVKTSQGIADNPRVK